MSIRPCFNDMEFFELIWQFERMAEQRQKENEAQQKQENGHQSISNMMGGQGGRR